MLRVRAPRVELAPWSARRPRRAPGCALSSRLGLLLAGCTALALVTPLILRADTTWNYAVQLTAAVQEQPPQITLSWPQDDYGAISYTVYRKAKEATSWGIGTLLAGATTNYTDTNVALGGTYEYQVVKVATLGYNGYGYIFSGIDAPLVEDRGKLILVVDSRFAAPLASELARLQSDLVGDGWTVIRHDVSTNDTPADVRALIIADYSADPAHVNTVFLFGHIPILQSGDLNYDGHEARPMPADAYYGDIDGDWSSSPDFMPSDIELMVGRVDMFNLVGNYAVVPWPSELELLRNYLNKDHNWRQKLVVVPHLALMGDRRGAENGLASAVSGYRNFQPLLGPGSVVQANVSDSSAPQVRWGPMLDTGTYLWAYGCGAGSPDGISELGTNGQYNDVFSIDIVGGDAKAVFVMMFGSWFGQWDDTDDFMRAFLATPSLGLTCCMAGVPHWFVHHMGLGETIGYGTRLTMNNSTLYQSQSNRLARAIYIALMGDPSLRMDLVSPPTVLTTPAGSGPLTLTWRASADPVLGYHIYRSGSPTGPFTRLTSSTVPGTTFTDTTSAPSPCTYMVRAVALQQTPSGTYYNASQGAFLTVGATPPPIQLSISRQATGSLSLTWPSQAAVQYRVLVTSDLAHPNWVDASGTIVPAGTTASWAETNAESPQRFYRIASP